MVDSPARPRPSRAAPDDGAWTSATHVDVASLRARHEASLPDGFHRPTRTRQTRERGIPGWLALVVLVGISGVGAMIDMANGATLKGGFNYGLVIASAVAIIVVRKSSMFPIVIAPPIVYLLASGFMLYIRSGGLHNRKVLIDAATNWLVYGFPAIAGATAVVLIIAGIRMIARR